MNLREIRKARGFTIPELSRKSGVPIRTIEGMEKRTDGKISTALKLSKALNVSLDELCKEKQ